MKKTLLAFSAIALSIAFVSCKKEAPQPAAKEEAEIINPRTDLPGEEECPATTVQLTAGQYINSGSITVSNDANFIYVTYTTANGYLLTQTHLFVGNCSAIPVNGQGNPVPGQFPYASPHNYLTSFTYQIPISALPAGSCGCIAAHAVVVKLNSSGQVIEQQTGWGQGVRINPNGGNWGMKFEYCSCSL